MIQGKQYLWLVYLLDALLWSYILNFNINNMRYMLYECVSLEEIIISNFDTESINDMGYIFYKCLSVKKNKYL